MSSLAFARSCLVVLTASTVALGCGEDDTFVQRPTQAAINPGGSEFWDRPMPSDLRREADGTVDFERWPGFRLDDGQVVPLLQDWFRAANRRLVDGWGVTTGVFMRLSGPVQLDTLPSTPADSLGPDASVFLLDIDPASPERGRRFPVEVSVSASADRYRPTDLLAAIPVFGFVRRERTRYALVVTTDVLDADGVPLGRSRPFHDAFEGELDAYYAALRDTLAREGMDPARVAGAAVFTTFDHSRSLGVLAAWAETLPTPALTSPWRAEAVYDDYQVLTATFEVPVIQSGERPYSDIGEGLIVYGDDGQPSIQSTQDVRLVLTIPRRTMPDRGFPLTIYMHGSGGDAYQAIERGPVAEQGPTVAPPPGSGPAQWLAQRGVASVGFDFPLHGTRNDPPDSTGLLLYNLFGNIEATIDNFQVSAMELTLLSRLLNEVRIDPAVAPPLAATQATEIFFDPDRLTAFGQSMGTTIGSNWAAVDPRVQGLLFSGAGGMLVEIAFSAVEPFRFNGLIKSSFQLEPDQELGPDHPVLHAAQNLWDLVDPVAKANRVTLEPYPGFAPRQVMMTAGYRDGYFHPRSQAAMAVAMGLSMVGDPVEPIVAERLALAGRSRLEYPATANLGGQTAVVVPYAAPNTQGHYVVFNQPAARHQYTCFLASVGTPSGAVVPPPGQPGLGCP